MKDASTSDQFHRVRLAAEGFTPMPQIRERPQFPARGSVWSPRWRKLLGDLLPSKWSAR